MTSSGLVMLGTDDCGIVILFVLISILAASAALDLAERAPATCDKAVPAWLTDGAPGEWNRQLVNALHLLARLHLTRTPEIRLAHIERFFLPPSCGFAFALLVMGRQDREVPHY